MKAQHNKKIVSSCVALVYGRIKNSSIAVLPFDDINKILIQNNIFKNTPFLWIGILFRMGIVNNTKAKIGKIDQSDGELPIALELDMDILMWADRHNLDLLHDIFMIAALEALIQVGKKYKFSTLLFEEKRAKYGSIPNSIEECEAYGKKIDQNSFS